MNKTFFKIIKKDKNSKARLGVIHTSHGDIQTPAFVPVGTNATIKSLSSDDIKETKTQLFFVNTYHTYLRPGTEVIKKAGGLHKFMKWNGPIITDSGGFQAFSLAQDKNLRLIKLQENRILFRSHIDGTLHEFTPEKSIQIQTILRSDIILPLDDCTEYPASYQRTKDANKRTFEWAIKSLSEYQKLEIKNKNLSQQQILYGIVQGGTYEDLRIQSAKNISSLNFDGYAIGGVAVGENKKQMRDVCDWVLPHLPVNTPKHLLGVGEIDDIFDIVERGIDTFDCVMPTRLARMGTILVNREKRQETRKQINKQFQIDIVKSTYKEDFDPFDKTCGCTVCKTYSRAYIHHLFKAKELLGYRLATFHNVFFINSLVEEIRDKLKTNTFEKFKKEFLEFD
jgi:queuine tRNA-ribosyltransferase